MEFKKLISKMKNFYIIACFLAFAFLFIRLTPARAQNIDMGIYPPIFQIQTTPPADVRVPFVIQNYGSNTLILKVSAKPFTASDTEDGKITFLEDTSAYPDPFILNRVSVLSDDNSINSITLSPKERKDLTLEIEIPGNEAKGDYYFTLVFYSQPQTRITTNETVASAAVAGNVLLTVGPSGPAKGLLEDFSAPQFLTQGPVPFSVRIKNTSDHFLTPKGNIVITNIFGQTIGKVDLLPVNVLSNTVRRIPDSLQSPAVDPKFYQQIKDTVETNNFPVAVWPEKFLLGPYTATLTLYLSDSGPSFKKQITFFALPIEYLLGILIIIIIVIFITLRVKGRIYAN